MEINKIPMLIVGVVVALVLAGATLPIWADTLADSDTFTNEGYFYVESPTDDDSITYLFDNGTFRINGDTVKLPTDSQYPDGLTILYTEHICIRYDSGLMKVRGIANHNAYYLNVTVTNGTITGSYEWDADTGPSTINWRYTEFTGMTPNTTDRVMCKSEPQYMNSDSVIDTAGLSRFVNITEYYVVHINGTINDGVTVHIYNQGNGTEITNITVSDISVNYTEVSTHEDLYKLNSITFKVTDQSDHTDNITFTIYTIPAEVTADRVVYMGGPLGVLVGVLPLLIVAGLVTGAVVWFINRKG